MNKHSLKKIFLLLVFFALSANVTAFAESRSITYTVSCSIAPNLDLVPLEAASRSAWKTGTVGVGGVFFEISEISLPNKNGSYGIKTNLGKDFTWSRSLRKSGGKNTEVISVTAL